MFSLRSLSAEVMNRLTPSMFQEPSSLRRGLGAAGADVGAGVRLGEHHRGVPAAVDDVLGDLLVALVAVAVHDARERRAGGVHPDRGVGAEHQLADRPVQARGGGRAAEVGERAEPPVLGVHPGVVALLERRRHRRGAGLGVEDGRVAVAVLVRRRQVLAGHPVDLGEDRAGGLAVDLRERALAEDVVSAEHLEEVELDVAQVALVVAHDPPIRLGDTRRCRYPSVLLVGNLILRAGRERRKRSEGNLGRSRRHTQFR